MENSEIVSDVNEQIAYLRSSVIGQLIDACSSTFIANEETILAGKFEGSLIKNLAPDLNNAYRQCSNTAVRKIYRSQEVLDVELAGYRIIYTLMEYFVNAVFHPDKAYSRQLLNRIPAQYETNSDTAYGKVQSILDYITGMTDVYALDLYRKITGMDIS